jgi:iron complex outermembrane receptor protein
MRRFTVTLNSARSRRALTTIAASGGFALLISSPAAAADTSVGQNTSNTQSAQIEEVVVTAQHRMEKLQDVPISAQVIGEQERVQQNVNTLSDLSQTAPAVNIVNGGRTNDMYIRGIGSGQNESFDQSVGTFIDDLYHGRSRTSASTFLDLDHVEILRGPQSTFFGNNAIAGALNIVTKRPSDTFDASARALYGSYGQYVVEGAVGGPITDKIAVRAAMTVNGQNGWIDNIVDNKKLPADRDFGGRLTVLLKPTTDLDVTLKVDGSENRDSGGPFQQVIDCPPPAPFHAAGFCKSVIAQGLPAGLANNHDAFAPGQGSKLDSGEAEMTVNYHRWGQTITSVTGFYQYHYNLNLETDGTPSPQLTGRNPEHYDQFSQEFRLASPTGQAIEYMVGAYFQTDDLSYSQDFNYFFLTPALQAVAPFAPLLPYLPLSQNTKYEQREHLYSAFGSLAWNVTDKLKISLGLRATSDSKAYNWNLIYGTATQTYGGIVPLPAAVASLPNALGIGTTGVLAGDRTDQALMPSGEIQYKFNPAVMAYASYSRGFKAGGFNGADTSANPANLPFKPEYVDAYEIGLKSKWLDNRILINIDAFRSDYKNLQVAQTVVTNGGSVIGIVNNAAASLSQGIEFEGQWVVNSDFHLAANVTYLDSHYINYKNASPTSLQQLEGSAVQDLSRRPTSYAPKWSGTLGASYRAHLPGDYQLTTELSTFFSSSYFFSTGTDDPLASEGAYARRDGRLTLDPPGGRWAVDLIGKNLTNRDILAYGMTQPTSLGSILGTKEEPRSVAVQVRYHW